MLRQLHLVFFSFFLLLLLSNPLCGQDTTAEQKAEALYDRIMNSDGFDEAQAYEILGEVYPEQRILSTASRAYDQALASDNPTEIARIGNQLASQQYQPLQRLQKLILRLRDLPASDSLNRALALLLLERNYQLPDEDQEYQELLSLLGAPAQDQLADPLDWADPRLVLEALLLRYRTPLPEQVDATTLQARLTGLEHCLQLLHHLRRTNPSEQERLALAATVPPLAHRALVLALQLHQEQNNDDWLVKAFQLAEQAKATLLADRLQGYTADRSDLDWPSLGKQLRLARKLAIQKGDFFAQDQELRQLIADNLSGSQLTSWPPPPSNDLRFEDIQQLLRERDALLVSYFRIGDQGVVFSLDGAKIQVEQFYWNKETQSALQQLRQEMEGQDFLREPQAAYQRFCKSSFWLYENVLLRPALRHTSAPFSQLILLPDAELWDIPFSALITRPADADEPSYSSLHLNYLLNDFAISLAPSAASWLSLSQRSDSALNVAAMAPDFAGEAMASRQACNGLLTALPHSVGETEAILGKVEGEAFLGTSARLASLQVQDTPFSVWHLATHACRQADAPEQSAVFLQDGPLTAQEIAVLPLSLQLVVLSACETQSGPYQSGAGVLSIGRAFLQGGARSMIGSLWPVSDAATAELMPLFYGSLAAGDDTSAALRQAQLTFLQQQDRLTAHPHYWAGFVLVGPSVSFSSASPLRYALWLVLGGGLVMIAFYNRQQTV